MPDEERYCSNCRALIPGGESVCPACGVYAGDVFRGRLPRREGTRRGGAWGALLILLIAGAWFYMQRRPALPRMDTGPVHVVNRPGGAKKPAGAAISEPEAIRVLRKYFATQRDPIKSECLAVMSKGYSNGAYFLDAFNRCNGTRLGRWRVDARTQAISR